MSDNKEYIFQVLYSLLDYFDLNIADDASIEKMDELYDKQGLSEDDLEGLNIICDYFLYKGKSNIYIDQKRILGAEQVLKEVSDKLLDEIIEEMGLVISSDNNRRMVLGVLDWYKQKYKKDYGQEWDELIQED